MRDFVSEALAGHVVVNIGQVTPEDRKALDREVRAGRLCRWRGRWFPTAGAPWGIGPLKTCWGTPAWRDLFASFTL